jgi:hypothetical protein
MSSVGHFCNYLVFQLYTHHIQNKSQSYGQQTPVVYTNCALIWLEQLRFLSPPPCRQCTQGCNFLSLFPDLRETHVTEIGHQEFTPLFSRSFKRCLGSSQWTPPLTAPVNPQSRAKHEVHIKC